MTPFWAFIFGIFFSGMVLSVVFGSFHLEAEDRAYQKGFMDGVNSCFDPERSNNETYI